MSAFLCFLQARCQAPAQLSLQQSSVQPVRLEAAQAGRAASTASVSVPVANHGNTSLAVSFGLERRNDSVLVPNQWLDPGSGYQQLFSGSQGSCSGTQVREPACRHLVDTVILVVELGGSLPFPYKQQLRLQAGVLNLSAQVFSERIKVRACSYSVVSTGKKGWIMICLLPSQKRTLQWQTVRILRMG